MCLLSFGIGMDKEIEPECHRNKFSSGNSLTSVPVRQQEEQKLKERKKKIKERKCNFQKEKWLALIFS